MAPLKTAQLQKGRGLDLAKPFDKDTRRILEMTVDDLIRKRGQVDSKMTMALERHGQSSDVQYQQDSLLQLSLREKAREKRFIRRQTKVLDERQKLLDVDPSGARARDVDLLKSLLSRLRDEPSTSSEALKHQSKDGDLSSVDWDTEDSEDENDDNHNALDDDLSASPLVPNANEKRKRDDDNPQSSKKLKNGHGGKDTQAQGEKGQHDSDSKRKKKHKKSKSISFDETKTEKEDDAPKTSSGSITPKDVEHAENTSYGADLAKGQKKKKKSKSATAHLIEHGDEADVGETSFSHQKSEAQNHASSPFTEVKAGKDKKKHKKSRSNAAADIGKEEQDHSPEDVPTPELFQEKDTPVLTHGAKNDKRKKKQKKIKHAEFAHTVTVIDDVKGHEQLKVAEASPGSEGTKDSAAFAKYNKSKKERRISDNTIIKESQANAEPDKSVHDATVAEPTIIEGKKKKKLRSKSLSIAEKDDQAAMPDRTKDTKSSIDGPQKVASSPGTALKGPTRIHPATPDNRGSFVRTAGHTPYNPFLSFKPHSVQHPGPSFVPEKSPKSAGGQVWVLDTTGSRKKQNKSLEDDTKSVTMTIGKVDTPHKVDQGSPTPPSKKDQKKRGRPKKAKEPLVPVSPHRAGPAAQTATPRARASSDLAALLGSPKRAKKLQKVLKEDRAMLEQEKKSWYEAVGLEYKD
ncbi:hypothetical protein BDP81DRAFT_392954 [Colletotrichum phormii]|uniref:Uncharacterized protein n=1 Tax=Colletotrichum phormii TaxID=359342 RepID=A0AAI9ZUE8_9PEZI|nr:uncharacterized protein BDP81DRAFT_392954 [Colletotrichum phormii]KAK1638356.1 hypothetical protein BDP81DRAFT_392954 [Colletotrichum phormii]